MMCRVLTFLVGRIGGKSSDILLPVSVARYLIPDLTHPQENVAAVNEALNELYTEDEDYEKLRESVDDYDNFDQVCMRWYVFASVRMCNVRFVMPLGGGDAFGRLN